MRTFNEFKSVKESSATDIGNQLIGSNSLSNKEEGGIASLMKVIKLAWERYHSETKNFIGHLAAKDPDIGEEFNKIQSGGDSAFNASKRLNRNFDNDIIPSAADGN